MPSAALRDQAPRSLPVTNGRLSWRNHLPRNSIRDRPLSFHWSASDLSIQLGLGPPRSAHHDATRKAILAEAVLAAEAGQRVSYSRRRGFYSEGKRYRGTSYTYASVIATVAELERSGCIVDCRVPQGNRGWQSSFVATDKLVHVWGSTSAHLNYADGEIIRLKNTDGELIDYLDSPNTRRLRRQLAAINKPLASLHIELPDVEWRGRHMLIDNSYILPVPGHGLHRIFSRGSWSLHGRAYGWFQSIPKTARLSLTINGEPVAEADYGSLHASILYNEAGIPFVGDAYDIDGFNRAEIKLGFNIAINARNERAAISALANHLGEPRRHCANVIAAIKHRHKPVERHFWSDAGVRLMRIDSELILSAVKAMNDMGDPALPIHDALIVPARYAEQAASAMFESFERIVGRANPCNIKIKGQKVPQMGERPDGPSAPTLSAVV
jgi:hypothetical protein